MFLNKALLVKYAILAYDRIETIEGLPRYQQEVLDLTIWIAILLGLVQGLCEFLPISSSGHLVLLHNIFGIEEGALFFTTMLHVGTLIAVFAVYWKEVWSMLRHPFSRKVGLLLTALVPTVVIALLFKDFFEDSYQGAWLGVGFLATAIILTLCERLKPRKRKNLKEMRYTDALLIGAMQGVAILPGISRSGSTIAGGLFAGLERKTAADFSFLLSIPAILGSVVLQAPDMISGGVGEINWWFILAGMAAAALSGYFAIRFMLMLLTRKSMKGFAIYVAILGLLVILDQLVTNVFFTNPLV